MEKPPLLAWPSLHGDFLPLCHRSSALAAVQAPSSVQTASAQVQGPNPSPRSSAAALCLKQQWVSPLKPTGSPSNLYPHSPSLNYYLKQPQNNYPQRTGYDAKHLSQLFSLLERRLCSDMQAMPECMPHIAVVIWHKPDRTEILLAFFVVLGMDPGAAHMLGQHWTNDQLHPWPSLY